MSEEIGLSFATSIFSLGVLVVTKGRMKVSVVTLLELRFSSTVYARIVLIAGRSFSFENGVFGPSLCLIIVSNISL